MSDLVFLKLGGSLITDKSGVEAVRRDVLQRLAREIEQARQEFPQLKLLLGHGSGSFGHVAGAKHSTRQGVKTAGQWAGFVEVSSAASRLNALVMAALLDAGVPALRLQPSASAVCEDGIIRSLAIKPIEMALKAGLVPVIFGDVAFDQVRGGTIISTEEVMIFLASHLKPSWLLLAGETSGVLDSRGQIIPLITKNKLAGVAAALGGSSGTDVTGGMAGKVHAMLDLVAIQAHLKVRIFSGLEPANIQDILVDPDLPVGTLVQ